AVESRTGVRVIVVDPSGRLREARVERIPFVVGTHRRAPALAVDSPRGRALLVGSGLVAEVALDTLRVAYHRVPALAIPKRVVAHARRRAWEGTANPYDGSERDARVLWPGVVAVTGVDSKLGGERAPDFAVREARLPPTLLDVRTWTARRSVLATGEPFAGRILVHDGAGIVGYDRTGRVRYRLRGGGWLGV